MRAIKGFGGVRKNKQACGLLVGLLSSWRWTSGGDCPDGGWTVKGAPPADSRPLYQS